MSPEVEVELASVVAEAGKQLTQANEQKAAQEAALQAAQDPVAQMKQAELQLKAQDIQRKAKKDADDLAVKKAELQLKAAKDKEQLKINKAEIMIDAQKENVKLATDKQDKEDKRNIEILKTIK